MELVGDEVDGRELCVGDLDRALVGVLVEFGVDLQAGGRGGGTDEGYDGLAADERLAAPVAGDEAEQAVFDFVPLAGSGREVADPDLKARLVGQVLQLGLPQTQPVAVSLDSRDA